MKAVDFIRKFGWGQAKGFVEDNISFGDAYDIVNDKYVSVYCEWSELKQYVDAWGLVVEHITIDRAKRYAESKYTAPEIKKTLGDAIQLVESVGSLSHYEDDLTDHCTNIKNHVSPLTKVIEG